ncbi:L-proline glycine betaine binding ABC transporter protein ProX / Osmotic adaptation [Thermococcus sp. 2319x1]|uniref:glycine betaine ABC transporter substrate-binding protein n=1 Tax=Thermococcus sp. 2319x1 TaxID=1674923 RepID=UPI00073A9CCD|nr:glycine betaine ABC transporter substrate-binding protein [Thermococcus sp. 2319x1]ALV63711.1 L-proline glycine betaine binding ABC transporter protein ProX / Osmotic adaptation [Thermococcus sp. 2319x1]
MRIVIGAKPFNEQRILAHVIGKLLKREGFEYEVRVSEPRLEANIEALEKGEINIYVEYTGTAYNALLKLPPMEEWDEERVFEAVREGFRERGIEVIARLGFRNDFALAVKKELAEGEGLKRISDLARISKSLTFACPAPYIERPDGLPRLREVYGLEFGKIKPLMPREMYEAISKGEVDVITAFTTDARVDAYRLALLEDDKKAIPPYEAIIIARGLPKGAVKALKALEGRISTETMRRLNHMLDFGGKKEEDIAEEFLVSLGV